MVTAIAELSPAGLELYPGDYDDYLAQREARQALLEARARNQAKRVAEIERFIERFRYKASKARQVQSRIKMLGRLERVEVDGPARKIRFAFPAPPRTGRHVVQLRRIAKAYGPKVVYAGIDLDLERGDRVALVGPNGAGKSTLLRILAGVLPPDGGERVLGRPRDDALLRPAPARRARPRAHRAPGDGGGRARHRSHPAPDALRRLPLLGRRRGEARRRAVGRREGAARARPDAGAAGALPVSRRAHEPPRSRVAGRAGDGPGGVRRDDGLHLARPVLHQPPRDEGRRGPGRPAGHAPRRVRRLSRATSTARRRARRRRPRTSARPRPAPRRATRRRVERRGRPRPGARPGPAAARGPIPPCGSSGGAWTAWRARSTRSRRGSPSWGPRSPTPGLYADAERARAVTLERRQAEEHVAWLLERVGDALRGAGRA